ncbi:hypothetical protein MUK70_11520 [Dyadobacter chenwenxiniae]|uniref:Uncharacterized protein n=1 Tax=Dyadobacter chenwenxiniae TaxID=2906456 RepID=A0A9X1PI32_9BACT|nr:hypothetical protein [Dyadobacter chenwenxiniae]MCF0059868.1 hypothetical protein [Dyadobacter chenwenxiniae]UON85608.1 hypothetical protein MUK70_11520 [Dyadobacter chenwenxiniae]
MFYNFNRHKQKTSPAAVTETEAAAVKIAGKIKAKQRKLADWMNQEMSGLPVRWQKAILFAILGLGVAYCIWLTIPYSHTDKESHTFQSLVGKTSSIKAATPSPKQQAFENYLDSLEKAFIADSIYHSQQNNNDHAE